MAFRIYPTAGAKTIILDLKEGLVSLTSDLAAGPVTIEVPNGAGTYTAYTTGSSALQLTDSDNTAFIQGPGEYKITKPDAKGLVINVSATALVSVVSEV